MRNTPALVLIAALAASPAPAEPLSAIDWLSEEVALPPGTPLARPRGPDGDIAAVEPAITTTPISGPRRDGAGLLPPRLSGLPGELWVGTPATRLAELARQTRTGGIAALSALLERVLLAELAPPALEADAADGAFLLARIDRLVAMGALDQAEALLERAGPGRPELFARWFDISLLTGRASRACAAMRSAPALAPDLRARIFCLARTGDWEGAALALEAANAAGLIGDEAHARLARFLDPALADGAADLPVPMAPDPLTFRVMEASGQPMATTDLPLPFAHGDLRANAGWHAQLDAAERLARTGALPAGRLMALYLRRAPPASGGVWDRAAAIRALDVALVTGGPAEVAAALPPAWQAMRAARLGPVFARHDGPRLARAGVSGEAGALAFRTGLLSREYERVALARTPAGPEEAFLRALARGLPGEAEAPGATARAIAAGFDGPPEGALARMIDAGRGGEALLTAIGQIARAAGGDPTDLTEGLAALRALGLEDAARRVALEIAILGEGA